MKQAFLLFLVQACACCAFQPISSSRVRLGLSSTTSTALSDSSPMEQFNEAKQSLIEVCKGSNQSLDTIRSRVDALEEIAELVGMGQASASSGLLNGEWELLYSPEDITRSSPFFWAFRRAFPEQSDQIFSITDAIPAPIKEVGPAIQTIDLGAKTLVSRVKVATLGGLATSMMTTRCTIVGERGLESILLKVDTTKPEDSTVLQKLGPLGAAINENAQPFPSGEALEKVAEGSSTVCMRTSFCDEGLRISRNEDKRNEVYVWKRKSFGKGMDF
mmetsp:Transcript_7717/g.8919  ORF Transcript_7717/g.8919 Transcript_7717/m.8919 type:complete len:274 (+) Transcript_7717:558-1379(+)|eukprot:CAMPEP_0204619878 /NCGR_PEP_ID=MMETSP0717-20131115/6095_1 /ASSEMBLY_ACC=CAM_ASM_000666 /TAXON_ID=230516 /ORGANISM="Chaetoceros curvisetus" /LENGTH=273 /DNA_ID=CAMNT_0051633951 /DNA_START=537 /DNA_END=1358 /DNA_ORIENTATION=-